MDNFQEYLRLFGHGSERLDVSSGEEEEGIPPVPIIVDSEESDVEIVQVDPPLEGTTPTSNSERYFFIFVLRHMNISIRNS